MSIQHPNITETTNTPAEASTEPLAASIGSVITRILGLSNRDSAASSKEVFSHPKVVEAMAAAEAGDIDQFYFSLLYPIDQVICNLALKAIPGDENGQFLLVHSQFVELQFRAVIDKYEGRACGADKAGFLVDSLLEFFKTGKEITFNRDQQYTYHLPTKVFQTHKEVLKFFCGIHSFHYGHTEPLVSALAEIEFQQSGAKAAEEGARSALSAVLASEVGRDTLNKLANGHGTETDDGKAWLAASALMSAPANPTTGTPA